MSAIANPLAFPHVTYSKRAGSENIFTQVNEGMSLRDWFAGQLLASGDAFEQYQCGPGETRAQAIARFCYEMADAMLVQRRKGAGQ